MFDIFTDVLLWVSGKTGLTAQLIAIIGSLIVLPILTWITKKADFVKYEKWIDILIEKLNKVVYVAVYGGAQAVNDWIIKIPLLGFMWEKWFEPYVIKLVSSLCRLLVRFVMGLAGIISQIALAIAAGFNSRGESLVDKVEGKD